MPEGYGYAGSGNTKMKGGKKMSYKKGDMKYMNPTKPKSKGSLKGKAKGRSLGSY